MENLLIDKKAKTIIIILFLLKIIIKYEFFLEFGGKLI